MSQSEQNQIGKPWYDPDQPTNNKPWAPALNQTSQPVIVSKPHRRQWFLIKWVVGILTAGIGLLTCLILEHQWKNYFRAEQANIEARAARILASQKQRYGVLTKIFDLTKSALNYEQHVLETVTSLRTNHFDKLTSLNQLADHEQALNQLSKSLNINIENYPDLKANQQLLQAQSTVIYLESELNAAIVLYNKAASAFNASLLVFPKNISAAKLNLKSFRLFQPSQDELADVKMNVF